MIDIGHLRFAGDQLRAAWDNYIYVFSKLHNSHTNTDLLDMCGFPSELAGHLDTELAFIASYEPRIRRIKTSISRARNYSSGIVRINNLPPEILTRIFHLALAQPCDLGSLSFGSKNCYSKHLDHLTQVCNLWRRVAVSSCSLWTHVDLSASEPFCDKLITRANLCLTRAGSLSIELHVGENEYYDDGLAKYGYHDGIHTFLSPIYNRIQSLELATHRFEGFQRTLLRKLCFYEDSTLTKLALHGKSDYYTNRISVTDSDNVTDEGLAPFELELTHDRLERAFARLTALHLRGVFLVWSSSAYHGLVDLRLRSTGRWSTVGESDLFGILKSSPRLRILHYGLQVPNTALDDVAVTPVQLHDLEVVKIFPENDEGGQTCPSNLLRLLAPGTKPLRLSFEGRYKPSDTLLVELERFFTRSKVARFYTRGVIPPMSVLLRHATNLETVILHEFVYSQNDPIPSEWIHADGLDSLPRLGSLYISKSIPYEKELDVFVKCCPDGVVLHSCDVERDVSEEWMGLEELYRRYPSVRIADSPLYPQEDPTGDWDVLD